MIQDYLVAEIHCHQLSFEQCVCDKFRIKTKPYIIDENSENVTKDSLKTTVPHTLETKDFFKLNNDPLFELKTATKVYLKFGKVLCEHTFYCVSCKTPVDSEQTCTFDPTHETTPRASGKCTFHDKKGFLVFSKWIRRSEREIAAKYARDVLVQGFHLFSFILERGSKKHLIKSLKIIIEKLITTVPLRWSTVIEKYELRNIESELVPSARSLLETVMSEHKQFKILSFDKWKRLFICATPVPFEEKSYIDSKFVRTGTHSFRVEFVKYEFPENCDVNF
jgi:hypothetical protein